MRRIKILLLFILVILPVMATTQVPILRGLKPPVIHDPYYKYQWPLESINVEAAWKYSKGDGVVIAVIDSGIDYTNPDLRGISWVNIDEIPDNNKDDDLNGYIDDVAGWDFINKNPRNCSKKIEDCSVADNDMLDVSGHGTAVTSVIASAHNDIGIAGIAPNAQIMALKVGYKTRKRGGSIAGMYISSAIRYAADNDADIIVMSFGTGTPDGEVEQAIKYAASKGTLMVASAGNSGTEKLNYPAAYEDVISVGATDLTGGIAKFSQRGEWVDVYAPGSGYLTTSVGSEYTFKNGTSFSAPCVAGVIALFKSRFPKLNASELKELLLDSLINRDGIGHLNADLSKP